MIDPTTANLVQNEIGTRNTITQLVPWLGSMKANGITQDVALAVVNDALTLQGAPKENVDRLTPFLRDEINTLFTLAP